MDVTVRTNYDAPRKLVFAIAGDPSHAARWFSSVRRVRWHGEPRVAEGEMVDYVARFLARDLIYTYRIITLVPDERIVMRTEQGPLPLETTCTWWDEDGERPRTGMSLRNAGRPRGMTTLGSGAVTRGMKRAMRRDLERLRLILREEMG